MTFPAIQRNSEKDWSFLYPCNLEKDQRHCHLKLFDSLLVLLWFEPESLEVVVRKKTDGGGTMQSSKGSLEISLAVDIGFSLVFESSDDAFGVVSINPDDWLPWKGSSSDGVPDAR